MNRLKLFYCPGHMSFAPHVVLNEIGEPFESVVVSIKEGATRSDEFKRINPKGKIPVLVAGEEILTESSAILYYLAYTYPQHKLIPSWPLGKSRVVEWTNWLSAMLASAVGANFHPGRFSNDTQAHPGIKEKGLENLRDAYAQINEKLQDREWALTEGYSIVDPMLLIFFKWGNMLKLDMRRFEHWTAHALRMEKRPAVAATLAAENISIWE